MIADLGDADLGALRGRRTAKKGTTKGTKGTKKGTKTKMLLFAPFVVPLWLPAVVPAFVAGHCSSTRGRVFAGSGSCFSFFR